MLFICGVRPKLNRGDTATEVLVPRSSHGPTNLIHQIAKTDRVTVVYRHPERDPHRYEAFTFTVSGQELKDLLLAITYLRAFPGVESRAACPWQMQFYCGLERLGEANFSGDIVRCDQDYYDKTGILSNLYERIQDKCTPHRYDIETNAVIIPRH
jgi:hypothetical protein